MRTTPIIPVAALVTVLLATGPVAAPPNRARNGRALEMVLSMVCALAEAGATRHSRASRDAGPVRGHRRARWFAIMG